MTTSNKRSNAATLEKYRIALAKAESNPGIVKALAKLGYVSETLEEGKALLKTTRKLYDANILLKDEFSNAYNEWLSEKENLDRIFRTHRNKARLIFRNEPIVADILAISGKYPRVYVTWLETVRKFYREATGDKEIQHRLQRINLSIKEIEEGQEIFMKVLDLRAKYFLLKGDSKNSIMIKNDAFMKINDWMREFYGVAKLALAKDPELLEALGRSA